MDRLRQRVGWRDLSFSEEIFNSITHGTGLLLSIAALVILVAYASHKGTARHVVSFAIFWSMLIVLYLSSTLYHIVSRKRLKEMFVRFDHSSIFLLIAGTYTPYLLTVIRGPLGRTLFGIIRGLAIAGIVIRSIYGTRFRTLMLIVYLLMGRMFLIAIVPMMRNMPAISTVLLLVGGVCYSVGTIFYARRSLRFGHGIWHLFVLAGSVLHFFSILAILG